MRVNVYAEEMSNRLEIISKTIDGHKFTGLRIYLELPVTIGSRTHRSAEGPEVYPPTNGEVAQVYGPFMHRPGDDDSSAVTFWGKRDLRVVLRKALAMLDQHYAETPAPRDAEALKTETEEATREAYQKYLAWQKAETEEGEADLDSFSDWVSEEFMSEKV